MINTIINKNRANQLASIINAFSTPVEAANAINRALAEHFVKSHDSSLRSAPSQNNSATWQVNINTQLVYNSLRKLKTRKSAGSENISPYLIVSLADILTDPLTHLFCLSVE